MKASPTRIIRVLIAADHLVSREGLLSILKSESDINVIAEATEEKQCCELYYRLSPDVLMLDLRLPMKDGIQVITELMSHGEPKPRIIVMTTCGRKADVRRALTAGAKGYLLKGADPQVIREAIRKVAAGQTLLQPEITAALARSTASPELSQREFQVLQHITQDRSNKEIGEALCISEHTVKWRIKCMLTKLDATGRREAIATAMKRGLSQWDWPDGACPTERVTVAPPGDSPLTFAANDRHRTH